jgi:hypothetical protein
MTTEQPRAHMMDEQQRAQDRYLDLYGQASRLWWDSFVALTRETARAAVSVYEVLWRPYPADVSAALETVYHEQLERANRLRDVLTTEAQATRDTAVSLTDQFIARSRDVQAATAEAGRAAMRTAASVTTETVPQRMTPPERVGTVSGEATPSATRARPPA